MLKEFVLEQQAVYIAPETVTCTKCGVTIGKYEQINNQTWLRVGPVVLQSAHGKCECGEAWHWVSTDKLMDKLLERRRLLFKAE